MAKTKKAAPPVREPTPSSSGSDSESDYSSDDTVEDEDGAELTPAMDAAILRTLSKIRRGEGVYSGENILAAELAAAEALARKRGLSARAAKEEAKPFLLKDLHRANLLAGVTEEEETHEAVPLTNVEMERRARQEALSAFQSFGVDDDDSDNDDADAGGLLVKRTRDEEEDEEEDAAYRAFLLEMGGGEKEVRKTLGMADAPNTPYREESDSDADEDTEVKPKADKKKKGKKDREQTDEKAQHHAERFEKRKQADEDFLMDYILNRGWIDKSDKHVPTYDEIVGRKFKKGEDEDEEGSSDEDEDEATEHPWGVLDEEDEFDERADEFETQYNFRFEEPGSSTIITHPRTIPSLVRREDDSRKLKREARAERKAAEKAAREDETRRLKGEKRREMEGQLAALKKELGEDGVDWTGVEKVLEGEWDEDEWDRVVGALLEAKAAEDDDKPTWDDDIGDYGDEDDGWVEPVPWEEAEEAYEDEDDGPINMDADFIGFEAPKKLSKKEKRDKKRKRGDADADADAEASASASTSLTVAERAAAMKAAADELRGLDHEDVVGDLPTRFKYTRSAPASFGLTPAEILLATDAELNALVSVKHIAPYRRHGLGAIGRGLGKRVRDLKTQLRGRKWGDDVEENPKGPAPRAPGGKGANALPLGPRGEGEGKDKRNGKRLGKKQRQKLRAAEAGEGGEGSELPAPTTTVPAPVPGKRKRDDEASVATAPDEGEGEGKKRRRKKKKAKGTAAEAEA